MVRKDKKIVVWSIMIAIFFLIVIFSNKYLTLDTAGIYLSSIHNFFQENFIQGIALFIIVTTVLINSPLTVTAVLKIFSGFVYGAVLGSILSWITVVIASMIGFCAVRYLFRERFEKKYLQKVKHIDNEIEENGFYYFLSLRVILVFPHLITNILGGLSKVKPKHFFYSVLLGVIPEAVVYGYAGSKLTNLTSGANIFSFDIIIALSLISLMSLTPTFIKLYKFIKKHYSRR